jgi:REP element-mobilizing transposase RayT
VNWASGFNRDVGVLINRDVGVAPTVGATPTSRSEPATPTSRLKTQLNPHAKNLRKGRYSSANQVYLITTVTQHREPIFNDFNAARAMVRLLMNEQLLGRADTLAFVIMPDHLHWLMTLTGQIGLSQVMQSLKTLSAKKIGHPVWQAGFHDHALRQEEDLLATARYIVTNPLRAGLVQHIGDYPHWDAIWL